jgi:hypothetical protein
MSDVELDEAMERFLQKLLTEEEFAALKEVIRNRGALPEGY